jgi:hypothetical protein
VTEFDYRLAVLTHGRMETLSETLDSFFMNVSPSPTQVCVYADGVTPNLRAELVRARPWLDLRAGPARQGFCAATGQLWKWASESGPDYVLWLEHDHVIERPVDLVAVAKQLDADRMLAQIALMRNAVSAEEIAAGGLFELRRGAELWDRQDWGYVHRDYFTTNVSLMRRSFMAENLWETSGQPLCEGRFGIDLVQRGYRFGVLGDGTPWTKHVGVRTGIGY